MNDTSTVTVSDSTTVADLKATIHQQKILIERLKFKSAYKKLLFVFILLFSCVSVGGVVYTLLKPNVSGFLTLLFVLSSAGCACMIEDKSSRD